MIDLFVFGGGGGAGVTDGDFGDITVSGSGTVWTIDPNAVTNSQLAQVNTATFKGRTTAGVGDVEDLTATQATALLNVFTASLKGLVPAGNGASGTFLATDGTWSTPVTRITCLNITGGTIAKFTPVYISGVTGGIYTIAKAKADSRSTMPAIGITDADIATASAGTVTLLGELTGVNTASLTAGVQYWVDPSTAGAVTTTKPSAPNIAQPIFWVKSAASNGTILVDPRQLTAGIVHGASPVEGTIPGATVAQVAAKYPYTGNGYDSTVGAASLVNIVTNNQTFIANGGGANQTFWYWSDSAGSSYFALEQIMAGGSHPYVEIGPFYNASTHFFVSAGSGAGVILSDYGATRKVANPSTVGPTLFSSSYPAFYAGDDDKFYFKNGAGTITQLTAPLITQDEGVTAANSTKTLNFTGTGVTATAVGETVTVNIPGVTNAATTGSADIDFGAFPGDFQTSINITGQTGILTGSLVEAWISPAVTTDHSVDEHLIEPLKVFAGNIVAGTGFTIYGQSTSEIVGRVTGSTEAQKLYGKFHVSWRWA